MVYKIALCDDEPVWIEIMRGIVKDFFDSRSMEFQIDTFDNAQMLLDTMIEKKEAVDILILDIDMPNINGFETAEHLKDLYPDIILMFYTMHEQYVFDAFKFQPFRYIRKEYAARELTPALSSALEAMENHTEKFILLKSVDGIQNIAISEIMYFETNRRRCDVYLKDGSIINVRKTIKELYAETCSENFVLLHRGAAVNVRYIKICSACDVTLENDTKLIASRNRIKDVKAAFSKYWGNGV
ncbi:MAG: LytTR family DNA-binding domain-containing protein [Acetatifactor sp.]|nr:LytTR family DNA-binding domain-containing protein [Acetatifactor sp.]